VYAAPFQSSEWAAAAGILHDIGKASDSFQAYLRWENGLCDEWTKKNYQGRSEHAWAGACHAEKRLSKSRLPLGRPLAYALDGHHGGLADWHTADAGQTALKYHLSEKTPWLADLPIPEWANIVDFPSRLPPFVKADNVALWIRMLFSCLVDADFLDTEAFMDNARANQRPSFDTLDVLKTRLDSHMKQLMAGVEKENTPVNRLRASILTMCRIKAAHATGLFSLTVPTGGGKTLASLAFALDHAICHGKSRIIYVIPYTSIIEQTADVFRGAVGANNVIEHHSNLAPEKDDIRCRLAAENWDAPLVVTTNVQFFESLFAAHPSRCRKLHNIANSVVILDEAQLVPPEYLEPIQDLLLDLTRNYRVSVVISTATQPAFPRLKPCSEMIDDPPALFAALRRVAVEMPRDVRMPISWDKLAADVLQHESVLCVVNRRIHARQLLELLPPGTLHLSAQMCGAHRAKVISEIKTRLKIGTPTRVVSTQLVEAGVDLDFPVVYRALAGFDAIAQAAGRCNREGRLPEAGRVIVFVPPESSPPGTLHKAEQTTTELLASGVNDPLDPATFPKFFGLFFASLNDTGKYISELLQPDPTELGIAFRSVEREFRIVNDGGQQSVIVPYGKSAEWLAQLRMIGPTRENMRRLQRFTVNLPKYVATRLREAGRIEVIDEEFWALTSEKWYDSRTGVRTNDEPDPSDLMVLERR
jgi:CRISPR-associated endonuclease/helicase Cas3